MYKYNEKRVLSKPEQSTLYNAYAAFGFKCLHCDAKSDLFIINKHGRAAHLALKKQLGTRWLWFIATMPDVRSQHALVCKACFFQHYAQARHHENKARKQA
jgi:hypothetical protein